MHFTVQWLMPTEVQRHNDIRMYTAITWKLWIFVVIRWDQLILWGKVSISAKSMRDLNIYTCIIAESVICYPKSAL